MIALHVAQDRALAYFKHLETRSLKLGSTYLELWGRKGMDENIHTLPDGSLVVVIGSPQGKVVFSDVQDDLLSGDFELPWDGRVILLRISADGKIGRCGMTGWVASRSIITEPGQRRIASTLEPAHGCCSRIHP